MQAVADLRGKLPAAAKDLRLNLQRVLEEDTLEPGLRYGVALASAYATGNADLVALVRAEAGDALTPELIDDAHAAVSIMAMNNVYYRFRHFLGESPTAKLPARLRMGRLAQPATSKENLELFALAVSAINGCELCVQTHDQVVREALSAEQSHAAARIAAVIAGVAAGLALGE